MGAASVGTEPSRVEPYGIEPSAGGMFSIVPPLWGTLKAAPLSDIDILSAVETLSPGETMGAASAGMDPSGIELSGIELSARGMFSTVPLAWSAAET